MLISLLLTMKPFVTLGAFIQLQFQMPPFVIMEIAKSDERLFAEVARKFPIACVDLQMCSQARPVSKLLVAMLMCACKNFLLDHFRLVIFMRVIHEI